MGVWVGMGVRVCVRVRVHVRMRAARIGRPIVRANALGEEDWLGVTHPVGGPWAVVGVFISCL